jgi:hypothetical protein
VTDANNTNWNAIDAERTRMANSFSRSSWKTGPWVDNPKWDKYKTNVSNDPRMMRGIQRMKEFPKIKAEMTRLMKEADADKDDPDREYDEPLLGAICGMGRGQRQPSKPRPS